MAGIAGQRAMIYQKLVESGEREGIKQYLRERLEEKGWRDEFRVYIKEQVGTQGVDNISRQWLSGTAVPKGHAMIPASVKADVQACIRRFLVNAVPSASCTQKPQPQPQPRATAGAPQAPQRSAKTAAPAPPPAPAPRSYLDALRGQPARAEKPAAAAAKTRGDAQKPSGAHGAAGPSDAQGPAEAKAPAREQLSKSQKRRLRAKRTAQKYRDAASAQGPDASPKPRDPARAAAPAAAAAAAPEKKRGERGVLRLPPGTTLGAGSKRGAQREQDAGRRRAQPEKKVGAGATATRTLDLGYMLEMQLHRAKARERARQASMQQRLKAQMPGQKHKAARAAAAAVSARAKAVLAALGKGPLEAKGITRTKPRGPQITALKKKVLLERHKLWLLRQQTQALVITEDPQAAAEKTGPSATDAGTTVAPKPAVVDACKKKTRRGGKKAHKGKNTPKGALSEATKVLPAVDASKLDVAREIRRRRTKAVRPSKTTCQWEGCEAADSADGTRQAREMTAKSMSLHIESHVQECKKANALVCHWAGCSRQMRPFVHPRILRKHLSKHAMPKLPCPPNIWTTDVVQSLKKYPVNNDVLNVAEKFVITTGEDVDKLIAELLPPLVKFQESVKLGNPLKISKRLRFVVGMRQATRDVESGRARMLILSPTVEVGLEASIHRIVKGARTRNIPVFCALSKRKLSSLLTGMRNTRVSALAVLNEAGCETPFRALAALKDRAQTALAMVKNGLRDAGYEYVLIDDGWTTCDRWDYVQGKCAKAGARDSSGRIVVDPKKFPSGMKALADYVHSLGLKIGIYTAVSVATCGGFQSSLGYEAIDAQTFADWDMDLVKHVGPTSRPSTVVLTHRHKDTCNLDCDVQCIRRSTALMRDGLNRTGKPIVYYVDDGNDSSGQRLFNPLHHRVADAWQDLVWVWGPETCNMWKSWFDRKDTWESFLDNLHMQIGLSYYQAAPSTCPTW
eukprot:m51a1_g14215 putative alpha-galactosidase (966) ;mRNA; f:175832-180236